MGKKFNQHEASEHHPGCIQGLFYHLHNQRRNFAMKKLPHYRRSPNGKWIVVGEDDGTSRPSHENGEHREFCDDGTDNSSVEEKVSEAGSAHKRSMKSRIKAMISDEVSKRKGRHKRSSSCPIQNQINQNSPIRHLEPIDESDVQMNEDNTARSSPNVQESMATNPNTCDLRAAMDTVNYLRQSEVNYKGKRPVKDDTFLEDKSFYAIDHRRAATLEESRLFLDALDLLNMRKELFLNVLRDPSSSLAQQLQEKRSSRSRERLSRSLSCPCKRVFEAKDVNRKHEGHSLTQGDTKSLYETKNSCIYSSAGEQNNQSMPLDVSSDEATPELPQRQPKPTGNVPPVSPRHLNTRKDKVVIKRFKNLGDKIRHAIKEGRKERQHIIKDGVLDKIPHGKKSQGYKGQVDTSEKPPKTHMKTNLGQKCFKRASTFNDSVEKYNRLLHSDANRQAKGKEPDTLKLRTNATPLPIKSIPKRLNRIYSSPDLEFYRGLQIEEALDSTCCEPSITSIFVDPTSREGIVISGKQPSSESSPRTENQSQMDKTSKCESKENILDVGEVLDAISKSKNIENACKCVDRISKCGSQENFVDAGVLLDKRSTFECQENIEDLDSISKCQSQENFEDAIEYSDKIPECSDKIPKCESQGNIVDSGVGLNKISICEGQENIVDADEGLNRISECESRENSVDAGDSSDRISKCDGQENMGDDDEGLDRILQCENRQNIVDVGVSLDKISRCNSAENIDDADEGWDRTSKCEHGENYVDADFGDAGDLTRRTNASSIDLVADKSNSGYQEDDPNPAKYNLQDDRLVSDRLLLDEEGCLSTQQHESSRDGAAIYEIERGSSATQFHDASSSQIQVDKNSRVEFDYVKGVLDLSGFNRDEFLGTWHSPRQPVDPAILDEVKGILLVHPELSGIGDRSCDYILLFDLINEVLLEIYHKSSSYWPKSLSFRSCIHPMPIGYHVLEEVWSDINYYLRWKLTTDQAYIDDGDAVAQDFSKYHGWMNLQFDSECVGLELEELLFDDLLDEILSDLKN